MDEEPPILRPLPRRTFEITPATPESPTPPNAAIESSNSKPNNSPSFSTLATADSKSPTSPGSLTPSRTRSALNLTSSTLFGIFQPAGYSFDPVRDSEPATPWGTGAQTPARSSSLDEVRALQQSAAAAAGASVPASFGSLEETGAQINGSEARRRQHRHGTKGPTALALALRVVALFAFGVAYGLIVSRLHENRAIAPVHVGGVDRDSWRYLGMWGLAGIGLGSLLPWVDVWWDRRSRAKEGAKVVGVPQVPEQDEKDSMEDSVSDKKELLAKQSGERQIDDGEVTIAGRREGEIGPLGLAAEWNPVVRSVGAFVGVAFAIRKLPWQSTQQVSATLALANPALWYLLDRSKPGLLLSTVVGIAGTILLLTLNPDMLPPPSCSPSSTYSSVSSCVSSSSSGVSTSSLPFYLAFPFSLFLSSTSTSGSTGPSPSSHLLSTTATSALSSAATAAAAACTSPSCLPLSSSNKLLTNSSILPDDSPLSMSSSFLIPLLNTERVGAATWVASVLFCSCVCFGNIGRRLALWAGRSGDV